MVAILTRRGDPSAVMSAAIVSRGDPTALVALSEILRGRLEQKGLAPELRVDRDAMLVDLAIDERTARRAYGALRDALAHPIGDVDLTAPVRARVDAAKAGVGVEADPASALLHECLGLAGARPGALELSGAEGARRIEAARARAFSSGAVAVGVVGPAPVTEALFAAVRAEGPLPEAPAQGSAIRALDGAAISSVALSERTPPNAMRLTFAVPVADPVRAIAAAERLGASPSPIATRAEALGFKLARAVGVASPTGGGCVSVSLEGRLSNERSVDKSVADVLPRLAERAAGELRREAASSPELDVGRNIALAERARDASRLAAWWALSKRLDGAEPAGLVATLELPPETSDPTRAALAESLDRGVRSAARAKAEAAVAVRSRPEPGHAETWVLVANPCALAEEPPHRWGSAALAAASVPWSHRAEGSGAGTVTIEPLVSPRGVGFFAHGTPRPKEAADHLATRLARSAAASFYAGAPTGDVLLATEQRALSGIFSRWSTNAPGLTTLASNVGDRPSLLEPFGPPGRIARFEASDLSARLRALASGPIVVAILGREEDGSEAASVGMEVARWMGPTDRATCERAPAPKGGRFEVRESRKGPTFVRILMPLDPSPSARQKARALAKTLAGERGILNRSAAGGGAGRASAMLLEGPSSESLLLSLAAPNEAAEGVAAEALALLARLARGELPEAEIARGIAEADEVTRSELADPRERLARLLDGTPVEPPAPLAASEVRAWITKTLDPSAAVVVLARPE